MKLELDMWHHLLDLYTKFQTDISKHVRVNIQFCGQTVSLNIKPKLYAQYFSYSENKNTPMILSSTWNEKYYKYTYMLYTFPKNSPYVIWSLKKALSHFPVMFFPLCPNNAFMFARPQFSTYWQGMCVRIMNNQICTYLQHKGKYFDIFLQIIRCPWNMCPLCYHSKSFRVTECSLSKFPAFCTKTHSKLPLIQNETLLLSALKTT